VAHPARTTAIASERTGPADAKIVHGQDSIITGGSCTGGN
jgi:hypothetical protein